MPYISQKDRADIAYCVKQIETPGELNYVLTLLINDYSLRKGLSYQVINDIIGALEGAKLEFYRRVAAPYENTKLALNGDVYNGKAEEAKDQFSRDFPGESQE